VDPSEFPAVGRLLAVDAGRRRIGLALSDPSQMLAQPFRTLEARGEARDAEAIARLAREHEVAGIVVGLPLNMDGTGGPECDHARSLIEALRRASGLPVAAWDERLTSVQAERTLVEAGVRRDRRRRGGAVDRVAAALLLQSFLAAQPARRGG
jgi:putative Holliday junction resolvase